MPTSRGWAAVGAGAGSLVLWVAFGEVELLAVGIFLLVGTTAALALVLAARAPAEIARRVLPPVVHEGDQAVVAVRVSNPGRRSLWHLTFEDEVRGLGAARFVAWRLRPGRTLEARYQIACRRRGVYEVGPAAIRCTDPLGLAEAVTASGVPDGLVVYPAVDDLHGLPSVRGHDPTHQASHPRFTPQGAEDFFTLREYQHGDDLRRVHWRSSAKLDELMIRQLENPWQSRGLVLLDPRPDPYQGDDAFEKAVRGAASIVRHLNRRGFSVELWAGRARTEGDGRGGYAGAMEALAGVEPAPGLDLRVTATRLRRQAGGGILTVVTGRPDADVLAVFLLLARDYGRVVLMTVTEDAEAPAVAFDQAVTVAVRPDESWTTAWARAVRATWATASAG